MDTQDPVLRKKISRTDFEAVSTAQAARLIGLSVRTLETMRARGGGPPFIKVTAKSVRYLRRDLVLWLESRRRVSTSDTGAAV
jgi:hypothetical protein